MPAKTLKGTLMALRDTLNEASTMKKDKSDVQEYYKTSIIPLLLDLRQFKRKQMLAFDDELKKLRKFNADVIECQMKKDCCLFEASKLEEEREILQSSYTQSKVSNGTSDGPTDEATHALRMNNLEKERNNRTKACEQLTQVEEEAKVTQETSKTVEKKISVLKPLMKQFVDSSKSI